MIIAMTNKNKSSINKDNLRATPELEDFAHKYTEEGQGKVGAKLLDNYFISVKQLIDDTRINEKKSSTAIEIGCGEGFSTERLRLMLPKSVELSASEYVANLVPKAQKRNPKVKIIEESVYETTHQNNTYDLVFLLEVLEHLDYPDKALAELQRIIKPGGYLIVGVPREPIWRMLNMSRAKYLKDFGNTPGHLNHWSSRGLKTIVESNFGTVIKTSKPLPWTQVLAQKK
jgi:2-polyprenyl-3-methyl-5-hydroxy-6-metoxy-1,4-benzoquinol methylase